MLSVSFLGIKENLEENLLLLDQLPIDYLHFDIMDGKFVLNKTWEAKELLDVTKQLHTPFDIHLMVEDVLSYIHEFEVFRPEYMTFHLEATKEVRHMIEEIHHIGSKVGISIKPNTKVEELLPYLSLIDLVLVMSVEPGKGGQSFLPQSLEKIKKLDQLRKEHHYTYVIEVDGGIQPETKKECKEVGADLFVVGSYITSSNDYEEKIRKLQ